MHHGILGMKWGVRRYQNEDGSLTNAGKQRYSDKSAKKVSSEYEQELAYNSKKNEYPSGSTGGDTGLRKQTREVQATKVTPEVASKLHEAYKSSGTIKKASSVTNNEGLIENKGNKTNYSKTVAAQLAKRESKSGVWKPNSVSGLGENDRQAHINQGDFSPWYGASYQEIREDLSEEELMQILMKALDEDFLSENSPNNAYWWFQLGDDLKFYISDAEKTTRKVGDGAGKTWNEERQVWNDMIDELTSNPKYKDKLEKLRGETAIRKIETYTSLGNNTPHVPRANGMKEDGKAGSLYRGMGSDEKTFLTDKDFEALKSVAIGRWAEAPEDAMRNYRALENTYNANQQDYKKKKRG